MPHQPNPAAQLDAATSTLIRRWEELTDAVMVQLDRESYSAEGVPLCSREAITEMIDRMYAAHELAVDAVVVALSAL